MKTLLPTTLLLSALSPPTMGVTEFYRSQIGGGAVINYSYTDMPWRLFAKDVYYFFVYSWALPWILAPLYPYGSDELDELYPNWPNLFCVVVHLVLAVLQVLFVIVLPFTMVFPLWMGVGFVAAFMTLNWALCTLLNGSDIVFHSHRKYAEALPEHEHEQWVFLNGVAVGYVFSPKSHTNRPNVLQRTLDAE